MRDGTRTRERKSRLPGQYRLTSSDDFASEQTDDETHRQQVDGSAFDKLPLTPAPGFVIVYASFAHNRLSINEKPAS